MQTYRHQDLRHLIDTHGKTLTLTQVTTSGSYDPTTGGISGGSNTDYTIKGYFYNYSLEEMQSSSISYGDRKLALGLYDTVNSLIPVPTVGSKVVGEGDQVNIVGVDKIMSGDNAVCYICQVRE